MKKLRSFFFVVPVVAVVLFAAGVAAQQQAERVVTLEELRTTIATQEHYNPALTLVSNVVGTGVSADASGRGVIKVYTRSGGARGIPSRLDGVPVVVQATGDFVALQGRGNGNGGNNGGGKDFDRTARHRPAPIGVSTGHPAVTAGTLGARVTDGTNVFALSNNHVYANINRASVGEAVLQPGAYDGGLLPDDQIGMLWDYAPLLESVLEVNVIDAAIALTSRGEMIEDGILNGTPPDGYGVPRSDTMQPAVGLRVMKYGRTTGLTKARISDVNVFTIVQYGPDYYLWFNQQILISGGSFSAGGDSGSLVVAAGGPDSGRPVGLLFAGGATTTLANPIDPVLDYFGVTIDGR